MLFACHGDLYGGYLLVTYACIGFTRQLQREVAEMTPQNDGHLRQVCYDKSEA